MNWGGVETHHREVCVAILRFQNLDWCSVYRQKAYPSKRESAPTGFTLWVEGETAINTLSDVLVFVSVSMLRSVHRRVRPWYIEDGVIDASTCMHRKGVHPISHSLSRVHIEDPLLSNFSLEIHSKSSSSSRKIRQVEISLHSLVVGRSIRTRPTYKERKL